MHPPTAVSAGISENRETFSLTLANPKTGTATINVSAAELESLIDQLGKARSQMAPQVSDRLDPGSRINAINEPIGNAEVRPDNRTNLVLRHPGFGWLCFVLSKEKVTALTALLASLYPSDTTEPEQSD